MAIIKFDDPVKSFAQEFTDQMNDELKKQVDKITDEFVEKATKDIKQKASEIAMKAGTYIMQQCVMMPWQNGYEVRIFINNDKKVIGDE